MVSILSKIKYLKGSQESMTPKAFNCFKKFPNRLSIGRWFDYWSCHSVNRRLDRVELINFSEFWIVAQNGGQITIPPLMKACWYSTLFENLLEIIFFVSKFQQNPTPKKFLLNLVIPKCPKMKSLKIDESG